MSFKNNWIDKEGRVFIYFTVEEIMKRRNISKPTAIKTLDELDVKKGIGLIERVRLGLGKPNIIYVKDFMSIFQVKENDLQKSQNVFLAAEDISDLQIIMNCLR
ncbi:phage protein [Streptococcus pneumoniae]|nr:phage protein [Streptococcus pneumoniae]